MVKTLDVIAYSVIDTIRPILKTTDFIDIRDVKNWIKNYRNLFAKQQADKNSPFIPAQFLQMEKLDMEILDKIPKYPNLTITKSTNLPNILTGKSGNYLVEAISYNDSIIDSLAQVDNIKALISYVNSDRFDDDCTYCAIINKQLVIAGKHSIYSDSLKQLYINAIFENPESISIFNIDTEQYPVSSSLISTIETFILKEKYGINLANYSDNTNDEVHNLNSDTDAKR